MGQREDLLEGAKQCLVAIGYGQTTSRDIAAASGANLASINYHYGTKGALLNLALLDALSDFGEEIRHATEVAAKMDASPIERFRAGWEQIVKTYSHHHKLLLMSVEIFAQVDRVAMLRDAVAAGFEQGRQAMVELFRVTLDDEADATDDATVRSVGSFFQAMATGVMSQWLVDPDRAPSADDLVEALLAIQRGMARNDLTGPRMA